MQKLASAVDVAQVAALVGDPTRALMLHALMDGRALPAGELAWFGRVSPQTASEHLNRLADGGLLAVHRQGRHRYYRLAGPLVGQVLEGLMTLAAVQAPPRGGRRTRVDEALQNARTCYDHLAGRLGVALADSLAAHGHVELSAEAGAVTPEGLRFLAALGVELPQEGTGLRFCRPCLDWTERRLHLGGLLGRGLAARCFELGWLERVKDSRAVSVTAAGAAGLERHFGIVLPA